MEIKTFTFLVNCTFGNKNHPDLKEIFDGLGRFEKEDHQRENDRRLKIIKEQTVTTEEMDKVVNEYIHKMNSQGKEVVNIIENYYTTHRHNNGYDDDVYRSVTVITKY